MRFGFEQVRVSGLLTANHIVGIQASWSAITLAFANCLGTALGTAADARSTCRPQDPQEIVALMSDLERFINDDGLFDADR